MISRFVSLILLSCLLFSINSFSQELPPINLDYSSYFTTLKGELIGYVGEKRRVDVKSTGYISKFVIQCLIATEDRDFYNHDGVSYKGLARGIWNTLTGTTQGGSTLTMQLARNLFLSNERTISRKLTEIDLAYKLEEKFSKDQILLLYLNTVYFGHSAWGIWAASQEYFQKTPNRLSVIEAATLVGLLQSPNGYDPDKNPNKLFNRRNEVLYNLVEVGKLSEKDYKKLRSEPLNLNLHEDSGAQFLEYVRKEAVDIIGPLGFSLSADQLIITTTLENNIQKAAENSVKIQYEQFPQSMKEVQVGLVSVDPYTGMIKAMIGGNPESSPRGLNHAVQIKRQPGSSFKMFLYGNLIEQGYTLATPLLDSSIVVDSGKAWEWRPSNSSNTFSGKYIPMVYAIENSVNLAAAYAITNITSPDSVVNFAHRLGIQSEIPSLPSIALGAGEVSPLEMASASSVYASYGMHYKAYSIVKIEDKNGHILYSNFPNPDFVLDSASSYLMTYAMEKVVDNGTASSIRKYYSGPAAGKTGTTQNSTDAWFVGYTPELATAVWIGFDDPQTKLKSGFEYGGSAAAPIWGRMMAEISKNNKGFSVDFKKPAGITEMELCTESGELFIEYCTSKKLYPVNMENPPGPCSIHSPVKERFDIHNGF